MLFFLTGDVQIGKTRWLEGLVAQLADRGIESWGVIAPGVWVNTDGAHANAHGLEKIGIDNVLLPEGTVIPFAKRRDIAQQEDIFREQSQSAQAGLAWDISDEAIQGVNRHFDAMASVSPSAPSLLVVDELGRLELLRVAGLTSALELLDNGPTEAFPHALVVVRRRLLSLAMKRLESAWEEAVVIDPDDAGQRTVLTSFGL